MGPGQRQAVLITGMHRSGTSSVAGAASLLGAAPPARMLLPAPDNPSGFWESPVIIAANDRILTAGNSTWYDCLGFDYGGLNDHDRNTAATFITASVMAEFPNSGMPLIKDPRICLLLDLWLRALQDMQISTAVLLVLRHPCEVMASMAKRDLLPAAFTAALWLRYMLAAEYASRSCPRHIVTYDMLLRDWRGTLQQCGHAAAIAWPIAFDAVAPRMAALLRRELRHHHAYTSAQQSVGVPLGRWTDEAYQALAALAAGGDNASRLQQLDQLHKEFRDWCRDHGRAWSATVLAGHPIRVRQPAFEIPFTWDDAASLLRSMQPGEHVKA
jgi:hypothetical protein